MKTLKEVLDKKIGAESEKSGLISRIQNLSKEEAYAINKILDELEKAKDKHPCWPTDAFECLAIAQEEAGEVTKAFVEKKMERGRN